MTSVRDLNSSGDLLINFFFLFLVFLLVPDVNVIQFYEFFRSHAQHIIKKDASFFLNPSLSLLYNGLLIKEKNTKEIIRNNM